MKTKIYSLWEKGYLYLALSMLLFLLNQLSGRVGVFDWRKEIAYFQFIKESFTTFHSLPWFWWNKPHNLASYPGVSYTSNFVGNPETMLFSPFVPLLLLMDVLPFVKFLAIIHCSIGIGGSLALGRRLKWDRQQFRFYAILFLLSPIAIQHLSLGYTQYINLFFFPWLVYFISDEKPSSSILGTSIILGLVLLEAGTHIFIWYAMLISLYFVFKISIERKWDFRLLGIFSLTPLLAFARIYSTAQAYAGFHLRVQAGYNPINFTFWALIPPILIPPFDSLFLGKIWMGVPSWDGAVFWGLALMLLLVLAKNYRRYSNAGSINPGHRSIYFSLFLASSVLFILSFFSIFDWFIRAAKAITHIPFVEGAEPYPFRLALPAFLGFSVVIAAYSKGLSQSLDEFWRRLASRSIIPRLARPLKFLTLALSVGFSLALMASVIFSRIIQERLHDMISAAYYGTGYGWISRLMEDRSVNPLELYYRTVERAYSQLQILLLMGVPFLIVVALLLRSDILKREQATEFVLAVPCVFATLMWFSLLISVPLSRYAARNILPPVVITHPSNIEPEVIVNPQSTTIIPPRGSHALEFVFPEISSADSKFLHVASNNAKISCSTGVMSLIPSDDRAIVIEFNSTGYKKAIALTVAAWSVVMGFCIVKVVPAFHGSRSISKQ